MKNCMAISLVNIFCCIHQGSQPPFPLLSVSILQATATTRKAMWFGGKDIRRYLKAKDRGFQLRTVIN